MAAAAPGPFDVLTPLPSLVHGPAAYFARQSFNADDSIRVGAWLGMLDAQAVNTTHYERLLTDCAFPVLRNRAFEFFVNNYEYALAARSLDAGSPDLSDAQQDLLVAELRHAPDAIVDAQLKLYLATGVGMHLAALVWPAEKAWGPRIALTWALRGFAAQPFNAALLIQVLQKLDELGDAKLTAGLAPLLAASPIHQPMAAVVSALSQLQDRQSNAGLETLARLDANAAMREPLAQFQGFIQPLRARLHETAGQYRKSFDVTARLNDFLANKEGVDRTTFFDGIAADRKLSFTADATGVRPGHVQLTGFPGSEAPFLSAVLAAHPNIHFVEDAPALAAVRSYLVRVQSGTLARPANDAELGQNAQRRYYAELDARGAREDERCIDKAMLQSASAPLVARLLPGQRSIFCLRHPLEVVLDCFSRRFPPSPATSNFHTISDTIRLYDFAMSQWFAVHDLNDPLVHYLRYEDVMFEPRATSERALTFLGLEWNETLPAASDVPRERDLTRWRHFDFAFTADSIKPLRKWLDLFGYETK